MREADLLCLKSCCARIICTTWHKGVGEQPGNKTVEVMSARSRRSRGLMQQCSSAAEHAPAQVTPCADNPPAGIKIRGDAQLRGALSVIHVIEQSTLKTTITGNWVCPLWHPAHLSAQHLMVVTGPHHHDSCLLSRWALHRRPA